MASGTFPEKWIPDVSGQPGSTKMLVEAMVSALREYVRIRHHARNTPWYSWLEGCRKSLDASLQTIFLLVGAVAKPWTAEPKWHAITSMSMFVGGAGGAARTR